MIAPTAITSATAGRPTDEKALAKPDLGSISLYFCMPVSTRVAST